MIQSWKHLAEKSSKFILFSASLVLFSPFFYVALLPVFLYLVADISWNLCQASWSPMITLHIFTAPPCLRMSFMESLYLGRGRPTFPQPSVYSPWISKCLYRLLVWHTRNMAYPAQSVPDESNLHIWRFSAIGKLISADLVWSGNLRPNHWHIQPIAAYFHDNQCRFAPVVGIVNLFDFHCVGFVPVLSTVYLLFRHPHHCLTQLPLVGWSNLSKQIQENNIRWLLVSK